MNFADATSDYEDALFVIFGVPYEDQEMSFRSGASLAPDFIRHASYNYETYNLITSTDIQEIQIHDAGDIPLAKAHDFFKKTLKDKKIPVVLGGAHSITPTLVQTMKGNFGVVVLDAHMDFRAEYLDDPQSHACASRRIFEEIGKERIWTLGVRSASREEVYDAKKLCFKYVESRDFSLEILKEIPFENIYLSVDMDVFDVSYAPGVSNPEPYGLGYELIDFIRCLSKRTVALDIVEVCPSYDNGITSILAAKIIRDFIIHKYS